MAFHQYNKLQYNTAQYNSDIKTLVLAESIASADVRVMSLIRALAEFLFLGDVVAKSVLNKGFSESVRTNDWLEVERKSQNNGNGWSS